MKNAMVLLGFVFSIAASAEPMTLPKDPCNEGANKIKMRASIDDQIFGLLALANPNLNVEIKDLKYTDINRFKGVARSSDVVASLNLKVKHISGATQTNFMLVQLSIDNNCNARLIRMQGLED